MTEPALPPFDDEGNIIFDFDLDLSSPAGHLRESVTKIRSRDPVEVEIGFDRILEIAGQMDAFVPGIVELADAARSVLLNLDDNAANPARADRRLRWALRDAGTDLPPPTGENPDRPPRAGVQLA